jgi:hypothetical protein
METSEFCDEFHKVDLRILDHCLKVTAGCQHVYNLAADMGGMGFIGNIISILLVILLFSDMNPYLFSFKSIGTPL